MAKIDLAKEECSKLMSLLEAGSPQIVPGLRSFWEAVSGKDKNKDMDFLTWANLAANKKIDIVLALQEVIQEKGIESNGTK